HAARSPAEGTSPVHARLAPATAPRDPIVTRYNSRAYTASTGVREADVGPHAAAGPSAPAPVGLASAAHRTRRKRGDHDTPAVPGDPVRPGRAARRVRGAGPGPAHL